MNSMSDYDRVVNNKMSTKAQGYVGGKLRGGWELEGWFYTIVGKSIIQEPSYKVPYLKFATKVGDHWVYDG